MAKTKIENGWLIFGIIGLLAVGVFAFFVTIDQIGRTGTVSGNVVITNAVNNVTGTGDSVFNIIGIVLIIGAIMSIVGLVYNYVR